MERLVGRNQVEPGIEVLTTPREGRVVGSIEKEVEMRGRARAITGAFLWLVAGLVVMFLWRGDGAQTFAQGQTTFTGNSFRVDNEGVRLSRRGFDAGARSHWHAHGADQLLFVQEGRMRYQREGSRMQEVNLHESTYLPGGMAHWHGAVPGRALTQVSVIFGEGIEWMEPVTDAQYEGDADR